MLSERIEKLRDEYTGEYVTVDAERPDLARFTGATGQVKTINMSGRALVEFNEGNNRGWYDVELDYLKVVDKPEPKPTSDKSKPARAAGNKSEKGKAVRKEPPQEKLSPLELARLEKKNNSDGPKPNTDAGTPAATPGGLDSK